MNKVYGADENMFFFFTINKLNDPQRTLVYGKMILCLPVIFLTLCEFLSFLSVLVVWRHGYGSDTALYFKNTTRIRASPVIVVSIFKIWRAQSPHPDKAMIATQHNIS